MRPVNGSLDRNREIRDPLPEIRQDLGFAHIEDRIAIEIVSRRILVVVVVVVVVLGLVVFVLVVVFVLALEVAWIPLSLPPFEARI